MIRVYRWQPPCSPHRHGGFTTGRRPIRRVIDDPVFGYKQVNVADQKRDPNSLLNWTERIIRTRKECAEIGWGSWKLLPRLPDHVLGIQYEWNDRCTLVFHNFTELPVTVRVRPDGLPACPLVNMLSQDRSEPDAAGRHTIDLEPYGYRWLRMGDTERPLTEGQPRRR